MTSQVQDLSTLSPAQLARKKAEEELQKLIDDRENAKGKAEDDIIDSAHARKIAAGEAADARANAAVDRETTKVAQEKAALDNETVRLDNEKKAKEGKQADYDSFAAKIASAIPKFSEIPMSTLSVPDGSVLRESENVSLVLDGAVTALVTELAGSPVFGDVDEPAFVITDDSKLAKSAVAYLALKAQITGLTEQAGAVNVEAFALLETLTRVPRAAEDHIAVPPARDVAFLVSPIVPDAGDIVGAAVAAAATAVTEIAALFQTESELSSIVSEPGELTVQAKLTRQLIGAFPGATIRLDQVTPVGENTELLTKLQQLLDVHDSLADTGVRLGTIVDELDGDENAATRAPFAVMKKRVDAVKARLEQLVAQITTEPGTGGYAPLTEAIIRSSSAIAEPNVYVLIVPPAKAYSDQVVVKRRLAAPRLSVSTFIELPYILLRDGNVAWAGTPSSRTGFSVRFT